VTSGYLKIPAAPLLFNSLISLSSHLTPILSLYPILQNSNLYKSKIKDCLIEKEIDLL